jgi:hypothetical protein
MDDSYPMQPETTQGTLFQAKPCLKKGGRKTDEKEEERKKKKDQLITRTRDACHFACNLFLYVTAQQKEFFINISS